MRNGQKFNIVLDADRGTRMTCREADCQQYMNGWVTPLDESQAEHAKIAQWIRTTSRRAFKECHSEEAPDYLGAQGINIPAGLTVFIFEPGQTCFRRHTDREVIFSHRSVMGTRVHTRFEDFAEHMNEESFRLQEVIKHG